MQIRLRVAVLGLGLAAGCRHAPPTSLSPAAQPIQHVILLSVDGLMPDSYVHPDAHGLRIPTLRAMVATGAWSAGARSVYPSVTYPAHTTMVTGRDPVDHGIHSNFVFDPLESGTGFHEDVHDIHARTLWDAARDRRLSTAIVSWPVAVNAPVDVLLPEIWEYDAGDLERERAVSTPGLFDRVEKRLPGFQQRALAKDKAEAITDVAVTVILENEPSLLLIHIWDTDRHQHFDGLWSAPAVVAIEDADRQIARVIDACKRADTWETTALVLLSTTASRA